MGKKVLLLGVCLLLLAGLLPLHLSASAFADPSFESVWRRTDKPVADGRTARSWVWGPEPFTDGMQEPYAEAPGGTRTVQYFDKSRMEINDPNADRSSQWFVTNGLLVREMVDGRIYTGNSSYTQANPSGEAVAGDPAVNNPNCTTYASFTYLTWTPAGDRTGQKVTATLARDGTVGDDGSKAGYGGTEIAHFEPTTGHNVPKVLWDYMNASGLIYSGGYHNGQVVDWLFAMGYPISEPYWARCTVGGVEKDVLVQLFERRVLTYTPSNSAGWQVEMGNVGRHYYNWRYGGGSSTPAPQPQPQPQPQPPTVNEGDVIKVADDGAIYLMQNGQRRVFPDWDTFVAMGYTMDRVRIISREQMDAIPMGDPIASIHACQSGMALVSIRSQLSTQLTLSMNGPESLTLYLSAWETRNVCIYAGDYSYTGWAWSDSLSGTKNFGSECQCWWWYTGAQPGDCDCSDNMADYSRP